MTKRLLTMAGALAATTAIPSPAHAACWFSAERVVGCFPDNADTAAFAYQRFRNNQAALKDPAVKEVLASASCRVIVSTSRSSFHIFRRGHGEIATLNGYEPISIVEFETSEGRNIFSVDSKWITGTCEAPPPPTVCVFGDPCNPK